MTRRSHLWTASIWAGIIASGVSPVTARLNCSAPSITIHSQNDAEYLTTEPECAHFSGEVNIAQDSPEDLAFLWQPFGHFLGSFRCQDNTNLRSLQLASGNLTNPGFFSLHLANVSNLESLQFGFRWVEVLRLEGLSSLAKVNMSQTHHVSELHLRNLPQLAHISLDPINSPLVLPEPLHQVLGQHSGDENSANFLDIQDVNLSSLDNALAAPGGWMPYQPYQTHGSVTVRGIPQVNHLRYGLINADLVDIQGNGDLELEFNPDPSGYEHSRYYYSNHSVDTTHVEDFTLSGINRIDLKGNQSAVQWQFDHFNATDNDFHELPVFFEWYRGLHIEGNGNLESILFNRWIQQNAHLVWESIVLSDNPRLAFNVQPDFDWDSDNDVQDVWVWPTGTFETMIFRGNFSNAFFEPFVKKRMHHKKGEYPYPGNVSDFLIDSTLGGEFDCSDFFKLKKKGFFPGKFSCQGATEASTGARMATNSATLAAIIMTIGSLLWIV